MPVKQIQSASRVLAAFEALAEHQPVGVGALARVLDDDKSAVQRALMTLADAGWIQRNADDSSQWEMTARVLAVAHAAHRRSDVRDRARPTLSALRDASGETALLYAPISGNIVAVDVVESRQVVRTAPPIGLVVPADISAGGQAILAHLQANELPTYIGGPAPASLLQRLAAVRRRGWAINDHSVTPGASAVSAAVLDVAQRPLASIAISGPVERLSTRTLRSLGEQVAAAATELSALP